MTREEVIATIQKYAEELGHVPSLQELISLKGLGRQAIRSNFISYKEALAACGLERQGTYKLSIETLFLDWASVVRKLGRVPNMDEYNAHAKHSVRPLLRSYGSWRYVPIGLMQFAREQGQEFAWKDVADIVADHLQTEKGLPTRQKRTTESITKLRRLTNEPVYGPPIVMGALTYCPTNEAGVAVLFGAMAQGLGFAITRVQTEFPDCEAMREIEPGLWQRMRIEFEYESRNFLVHMHPVDKCDLIVCWKHNWPECPLEVVELKSAAGLQ